MIRAVRWLAALAFVSVGIVAVAGGSDVVLDALLQRPHEQGTIVVPDRFLRSWDPLTVFFDGSRGPADGGPEDNPTRFVDLDPDQPGAWTWLDERTLQFRPAEPWPPLEVVTLKADNKTTVLSTLLAKPIATVPTNGAQGLGPVDTVSLVFPTPVDPDVLARMTTIELRALPGIGGGPATRLRADDFEVKVLDRASADDPGRYTLVLHTPIPAGQRVVVRLALSQDEGADDAISETVFQTAEPFRPTALGCDGQTLPVSPEGTKHPSERPLRCTSSRMVRVGFTAPLGTVGPLDGRNLVRFEPSVDDLSFEAGGTELRIRGDFRPEVPYRVSLAPSGLVDATGRALDLTGESVVWLYFARRDPYLKWGIGQGVSEVKGPKRVPLEGRGISSADLRIFKIDPRNRALWPFPEQPIAVDEEQAPPGPGEEPGEWSSFDPIPTHELARRLRSLGSPLYSGIAPLPLDQDQGAKFGLDIGPTLDRVAGKNAPGHYLVGLRKLDGSPERSWVRLQVTDLALTTIENPTDVVFQVTSLETGVGVGGALVKVEGTNRDGWTTLFEGRTTGDGTLTWKVPGYIPREDRTIRRLVVEKGDDVLVLDPARSPDRFADGTWLQSSETWLQWAFSDLSSRDEHPRTLVHLFPERPVYRPGEEVHLKGYSRTRFRGALTVNGGTGFVVVTGPGDTEWRLPVELSGVGSFYTKWQEDEPPTGAYDAVFEGPGGVQYGRTSFRVEAYRLPTFEVNLHGPENVTTVPNDRAFDVGLTAAYYAGGRVAARPIRWRVTQYPYAWSPATGSKTQGAYEGFAWSSDDRYGRGGTFRATPELTVEASTGATGEGALSLDPGVEADARPRTYVVEATVTGADDQTVTSTLRVDAVPAFVLGLKVPRFLEKATTIPADVVAIGPDGQPVADVELTVHLLQRQWHSVLQASDFTNGEVKYLTDVVDVPSTEKTVKSSGKPVSVPLAINEAGVYLVEVEARDRLGRVQVVRVDLYAGGDGAVGWEKPKAGTFDLQADKPTYKPGQTANIVVRSPFQQAEALIVVEAPDGNRYLHQSVRGGKATISLPVPTGWVPRVPVHVVLRKGRSEPPSAPDAVDIGKPQTVASTVWVGVEPVENEVVVSLVHPERALPGETVPLTVKLADPDGKPLAGEVTLWLVDRAVLALGKEQRLDPIPAFVDDRGSFVTLRDTRNLVLGRVPIQEMPGGDGEGDDGDLLENATVRKDFRPLAYYEPSLKVPATGTLTVTAKLPDNLTVFAIRAKAVSGPQRFGVATGELAVRLPVVVQPALPRFVRPADRFDAAAIARVVEGSGGPGKSQIAVEGLTLSGSADQAFTLDPALASRLVWPLAVPTPPIAEGGELAYDAVKVKIGVKRTGDGASDAFEVTLPVRDDRRVRYERSIVTLAPGKTGEIPPLPEKARDGSVRRSVVVASHDGLVRMASAVDVLRRSPTHGTDAVLARGRVAVGLGALRGPLGLEDDAEIRGIVEETQAWLATVVDARGLVANWPGAGGRVWLTANALAFLAEADANGYPADPRIRASLERALTDALRSDYPYFLDGESWMERTTALWGLSIDGKFDGAYFAELSRNTRYLVPEAQARVLLAATRAGQGGSPAAQELTNKVANEITLELYQGKERYAGLKSNRSDRTPFVAPSEARDLATILSALGSARPEDPKVNPVVDALIRLGREDGWGQPNADAAALLALADQMKRLAGKGTTVTVTEGTDTDTLTLSADDVLGRHTSTHAGQTVLKNTGKEQATALVVTRWIPDADGSQQAPEANGFVVEREWLVVNGTGPMDKHPIAAAGTKLALKVGDIVEEHLRLVNPSDRFDVVLTVPLAAGIEPLNPALATSGPETRTVNRSSVTPTWTSLGDDRALYAFERLPKGTYDLYFRTKATVAGSYVQPAATAEMVYDRSVTGMSAGARVDIGGN